VTIGISMKISSEAIEQFRAIHLAVFGTEITLADAELAGRQLIRLVATIQPVSRGRVFAIAEKVV